MGRKRIRGLKVIESIEAAKKILAREPYPPDHIERPHTGRTMQELIDEHEGRGKQKPNVGTGVMSRK